jgi:hypothetical protein
MKFVICNLSEAKAYGIEIIPTMRQSVDGTQVVLHEAYIRNIDEFSKLKRYEFDDAEFTQLMNSEAWTHGEDYVQPNEDYAKVKAMQILTAQTKADINKMKLSNKEKNDVKKFYPKWEDYIGESLNEVGFIVNYNDKIYEIIQAVPNVVEGQTPDLVPANYGLVSEHEGTKEDPIPYTPPMEIFEGKYYTQNGVLYKCTRDSGIALSHDLSALVGTYVSIA